MEPWTQHVNVAWRRTVRFFERRYEILRRLEDEGLLRQFGVTEDRVAVRLGDPNHEIVFTSSRLEAALYQPTGDLERVRKAVEIVFELLEPTRLARPQFTFQWLEGIEGDYDELRRNAARTILPIVGSHLTDFALLCDGIGEETNTTFRLECGIAEAAEIPLRLARQGGQLVGISRDATPEPSLWPRDALPDVAFFCDSAWTVGDRPDDDTAAHLFKLWGETRDSAEEVVLKLMDEFDLRESVE